MKAPKAPAFKLAATGDQTLSLRDLAGKRVVLWFYPKDATPGCTREGQDFRDLHAKFKRRNTVVLGVSRDSVASHERFREKQGFPFDLLSDPYEKACRA
jgi:peroxiredoxin Q/BCP